MTLQSSTADAAPDALAGVLAEVAEERRRQVEHGFDAEHDDRETNGQIPAGAAHYAMAASMAAWLGKPDWPSVGGPIAKMPRAWPWARTWWKPGCARRMLIKAIALLVAEVERRDRATARACVPGDAPGA